MKPETAESLRKDMFRLLRVEWDKAPRRMLAMSDGEQVAFAKSQLTRDCLQGIGMPSSCWPKTTVR
jgi:hypothetical protein